MVALGAVVACALIAPAAAQAHGGHHSGGGFFNKFDFVLGAGTLNAPPGVPVNAFTYAAWSTADNSHAGGFIQYKEQSGQKRRIVGQVICLKVDGDRASMIYKDVAGTSGQNPAFVGGRIFVDGRTLSELKHGGSTDDAQRNGRLTQAEIDGFEAGGCPPADGNASPLTPLRSGAIVVHDAT
jgi:hypothetical protein